MITAQNRVQLESIRKAVTLIENSVIDLDPDAAEVEELGEIHHLANAITRALNKYVVKNQPKYVHENELPGVLDQYDTMEDFLADVKKRHPKVSTTHQGLGMICMQSRTLTDLYALILENCGNDHERALEVINEEVKYIT